MGAKGAEQVSRYELRTPKKYPQRATKKNKYTKLHFTTDKRACPPQAVITTKQKQLATEYVYYDVEKT
ncbi:hypothetical protein ACFL54_02235 [Planctomycetota bacterium]